MNKLARRLLKLLVLIPAIPIVALARLLSPIVTIRFGRLRQDRIGHLAWNTELYLCERDESGGRAWDLFCYSSESANAQLLKMWARVLPMYRMVWPLWKLNSLIPRSAVCEPAIEALRDYWRARELFARHPTHLKFTEAEMAAGRSGLRAMGVPDGMPFVCFHSRDSAYLQTVDSTRDWSYHDFRDSTISNFLPAAEELVRRGYATVRIGAFGKDSLSTKNPLIIDYTMRCRSEFMDVFLASECAFFLGANSGIQDLAEVFRRPMARTNIVQFFGEIALCGARDVFITKRLWLEKENRAMSFREIARSPVWDARRGDVYAPLGIKVLENSPEEIKDLVDEFERRFSGSWRESPEDVELQRRFWNILEESGRLKGAPVSRICAAFLRRHAALLD